MMVIHLIMKKYAYPVPVHTLCDLMLKQRRRAHGKPLKGLEYTHSVAEANCKKCLHIKIDKLVRRAADICRRLDEIDGTVKFAPGS